MNKFRIISEQVLCLVIPRCFPYPGALTTCSRLKTLSSMLSREALRLLLRANAGRLPVPAPIVRPRKPKPSSTDFVYQSAKDIKRYNFDWQERLKRTSGNLKLTNCCVSAYLLKSFTIVWMTKAYRIKLYQNVWPTVSVCPSVIQSVTHSRKRTDAFPWFQTVTNKLLKAMLPCKSVCEMADVSLKEKKSHLIVDQCNVFGLICIFYLAQKYDITCWFGFIRWTYSDPNNF